VICGSAAVTVPLKLTVWLSATADVTVALSVYVFADKPETSFT
jgi:hypothetical protein